MAIKYIDAQLCRTKPTDKEQRFTDEAVPGFTLKITSNGAVSFHYVYRKKGAPTPTFLKIGDWDKECFTDKHARAKAVSYYDMRLKGLDPAEQMLLRKRATEGRAGVTFQMLHDRYIAHISDAIEIHTPDGKVVERARLKSWKGARGLLKRPLAAWGELPVGSIDADMIADLLDEVKKTSRRKSYSALANAIQAKLHRMFKYGMQPGKNRCVLINPLADIEKRGGKTQRRTRTLDAADIKTLWWGLDDPNLPCPRKVALGYKAILTTMLRPGEVVGAHRDEFKYDKEEGLLFEVPFTRVKKSRNIAQPLAPLAQEVFNELKRMTNRDVLFPSAHDDDKPMQRNLLSRYLTGWPARRGVTAHDGLCKYLGIKHFTPHDLRRTAATLVNAEFAKVANIKDHVEKTLDHLNDSVVGLTYNCHDYLPEKAEVLKLLDQALRKIIGECPATLLKAA